MSPCPPLAPLLRGFPRFKAAQRQLGFAHAVRLVRQRHKIGRLRLSAAARSAREAQERESRIATAALALARASTELSTTRNRMLDLANDTITAASIASTARSVRVRRGHGFWVRRATRMRYQSGNRFGGELIQPLTMQSPAPLIRRTRSDAPYQARRNRSARTRFAYRYQRE